jgi:ethanolamine ammonia-lyase large subunit
VMLNYQSTSFHDAAMVRKLFGLRPAPEFLAWLQQRDIFRDRELAPTEGEARHRLLRQLDAVL